ncbi:MAG: HAD family hydrolase [Oceanospirillaceae bacterium]|nr:HAD family hydrolase [Oceanospirillaceae bacterium]MCP5335236.1 HAD family hydrolase [Oceanospirillaceae bacterium]
MHNGIRLITFDLDDTLWDGTEVILNAEAAMQAWLAENAPGVLARYSPQELRELKFAFARENPQILHKVSEVRQKFLAWLFSEMGYATPHAMAADCFNAFYQARQQVRLFSGVKGLLAGLQQHYRLAALTNGNANIRQIGLQDYFEFCFCAEDFSAPKPAPDLFLATVKHSGLKPHEILHVGDHPEHDIRGASALGFKTCWLNDGKRPLPENLQPDYEIRHIQELAAHLLK